MLAPPGGEQNEHVCKLHGVATTAAGSGQYGYTHVWQLRAGPDVASPALADYQPTDATAAGRLDGRRTILGRRDHLYDCPLFDDRLTTATSRGNHAHSPDCRRHQVYYSSSVIFSVGICFSFSFSY